MQVEANVRPLTVEYAGERWWGQARSDVREFNRCEVGQEAYPLIHNEVGAGPVVIATVWLAFYLIAAIHSLLF